MQVYVTLGISLGIGLLIGLQRERTEPRLGGIRTFPLMSLLGTFCGLLAQPYGAWAIVGGFLVLFGILAVSDLVATQRADTEHGQTTEMAALLTFAVGAYLVEGDRAVAVLTAGVIVVLLHLKAPMHGFVEKMGPRDMTAMVQFVVVTMIVLPVLPNRAYDPFKALNPFDIWRMVVLIVGISLASYVALKIVGARAGAILGGVLGGLVSSTATTISYARRSKESPQTSELSTFVVQVASTVLYLRLIAIAAIVAPAQVAQIVPPFVAMFLWMALISVGISLLFRGERESIAPPRNPAELKSALAFGAIYAVVLLATAAVKQRFGSAGLYVVAGVSGLVSQDAITISISRQMGRKGIDPDNAWRMLLLASMANMAFKGIASAVLGERRFAAIVGVLVALTIAGGLVIIWIWPKG